MNLKEPLDQLAVPPTQFTRHLKFPDPASVRVYDDTLRDGEQMPGVAFSPEQKLELAQLLSNMGVHVIDPAFPAVSESDRKALQLIVQAQHRGTVREDIEILAMCRSLKEDIDAVADTVTAVGANPDDVSVLVLSTLTDLHLKYKLGKTLLRRDGLPEDQWLTRPVGYYREQNLGLITHAIRYARKRGFSRVEFAAEDAARSDVAYGEVWAKACVEAGGTRMCFSDTCGVFKHASGIHTAAIALHLAIYQFIAEEAVGGEQRFVFGKHSGAAAVESVLAKHVKTLHEHGVEVSPELVKRILDRVKSLREETLPERGYPEAMDAHYRQYYGLGLSEERIVELALEAADKRRVF